MAKNILFAALCLLLGAFLGTSVAHFSAQRHQHTRSVMGLAQFHLARLAAAAHSGQCQDFNRERERLAWVYDELTQAFPLAYAQDPQFRSRADALRNAVKMPDAPARPCTGATASADEKTIHDACDACHREYR
jgi:cytochrome c556